MREKLISLLEVRRIISLLVTFLFIALAFMGKLDGEFIQNIVMLVIAFYFAKQTALDKPDNDDK